MAPALESVMQSIAVWSQGKGICCALDRPYPVSFGLEDIQKALVDRGEGPSGHGRKFELFGGAHTGGMINTKQCIEGEMNINPL